MSVLLESAFSGMERELIVGMRLLFCDWIHIDVLRNIVGERFKFNIKKGHTMDVFFHSLKFGNIFFRGYTFTRSFIENSIDELALYLSKEKKTNSPFIYLFAPNHIKTVIAYFAIIKSGSIVILVDPQIGKLELQEMIATTPPAALINIDRRPLGFDYRHEISFCEQTEDAVVDDLSDVCTIIYAAADEGYAKAVMLTCESLLADANALLSRMKEPTEAYQDRDITCCALLPFHTMFGLQTGILIPLVFGASLLIEDLTELRRLVRFADDIEKYGVKVLSSIPLIYRLFSIAPNIREQLKHVDHFFSGGCRLSISVFEKFVDKFGVPVREGYGLTQASPICTYSHDFRLGSVGKALDCCEIKILDNDGKEVPFNTVGEICVRGKNIMKGYYKDGTQKLSKQGWLHTGDLGKVDSDCYLYITGLKKRMLNMGGRKIYPAEVERLIHMHNNIETVEIYGRQSRLCEGRIGAKVKLKKRTPETEDRFIRWCSKNISYYKFPRHVHFS